MMASASSRVRKPLKHDRRRNTDAAIVRAIEADLSVSRTYKDILRDYNVSSDTVIRIKRQMVDQPGTWIDLVAGRISGCITLAVERLKQALIRNKVPANQLHIVIGVLLDKHAQLTSLTTPQGPVRTDGTILERVRIEFEQLRQVIATPAPQKALAIETSAQPVPEQSCTKATRTMEDGRDRKGDLPSCVKPIPQEPAQIPARACPGRGEGGQDAGRGAGVNPCPSLEITNKKGQSAVEDAVVRDGTSAAVTTSVKRKPRKNARKSATSVSLFPAQEGASVVVKPVQGTEQGPLGGS
jgi:hypothetical protein